MKQRGTFERVPDSGQWWIRYADASGRIRREKAGTKSNAEKLYHKRKAEALKGKKLPETLRARPVTFAQIAAEAIRDVETRYRRPADEAARLRLLVEWFGQYPAESITSEQIEARLSQEAQERHWAPATINHHRSLMSLAYRLAKRSRKVQTNPVRDVRHWREDNSRVRELRPEEEGRLLQVIRSRFPWHEPEFHFARNTGLRQGNQYSLAWEMVDWEFRMLHLPRTKNEEALHVPLNEEAFQALRDLRARSDGTGPVFLSETGQPLHAPKYWFLAALRQAGISNFTWHDLRHDFATRLRRNGVPLEDIADLLGHKTLAMTRRYAHVSMDRLRQAVSCLEPKRTDTRTSTEPYEAPTAAVQHVN